AAAQAFTARAQGYYWQVEVDFAGASSGANETSPSDNRVTLEVNYVVVSAVTFTGGGGRDAPAFYREYENAGTFVQVTAAMAVDSGSGTAMQGDHDLVVNYYGLLGDITVTISSGSTTGTAAVEYNNAGGFLTGWLTTGYTLPFVYRVYSITTASDYYDTAVILGDGTTWNTDTGTTTGTIYWDRDDPPYYDASVPTAIPAINITNTTTAATSITLYWTEITLGSPNVADYNYDFYEYKVYFRENGATIWRIWDGDDDATLRYPAHTGNIDATYRKYTTIPNLKIFTEYEYYVTAVDVFGNEVTEANAGPAVGSRIIRTQPFSITATISDGVTTYSDFSDLTPSQRPVRLNNIKVTLTIVSSSDLPDTVTVWYTTGNISTAPDMVASNTINSGAFATDTLFSSVAERTGPNEWVAYLQTTSAIMQNSNSIRFIVQNTKDSISAYSDSIVEASPATDPNDDEWTFEITSAPIFTPWPVRILNNVIKDSTPAYPSYYLSEDANVTIKIYDIKGRPVVTLLDGAYRRGGQNIKDQGWSGVNKAGRKVGVGLYYIHIKAESTSNGTVILNKFKKVVMAK
ncbi:MAG: hypothetical protein GY754_06530, partial [bacterium]|nr:hypothetical protein [bacterium]